MTGTPIIIIANTDISSNRNFTCCGCGGQLPQVGFCFALIVLL